MKKIFSYVIAFVIIVTLPLFVVQATENEPGDTMMNYALIRSIGPSIDKALADYYEDPTKRNPQWIGLGEPTWTAYFGTKLQRITQLDGEGGAYDIMVLVTTYVGPLPVAEFEITVRVGPEPQKVIKVKHIQDLKWDLARDEEKDKRNYALLISMAPSIDKAINAYYKDSSKIDPDWPSHPTWTSFFGTEIVKIEETKGFGGGVSYDITVKISPWVGAHSPIAEFEQVIRLSAIQPPYQETVSFKHIKDIPYERY